MQNFECNLEGQKIAKKRKNAKFPAVSAVCAGLGGRIIGCGGGKVGLNFKPDLKARLLKFRKAFKAMLGTLALCLARLASLREVADVLRTDCRTRGKERQAAGNTKAWLLHA